MIDSTPETTGAKVKSEKRKVDSERRRETLGTETTKHEKWLENNLEKAKIRKVKERAEKIKKTSNF